MARRPAPRSCPRGSGELILAGCDRETLVGSRDHAMIILIVRLGYRAGEVAAVELDDLRWGAGELVVSSKGGGRDPLAIPVDVGPRSGGLPVVPALPIPAPTGSDTAWPTDMLAEGARLEEIGQVLRHRHLETTALYGNVDHQALAAVARSWPGSQS
jgi:integrase/recombinase XerD